MTETPPGADLPVPDLKTLYRKFLAANGHADTGAAISPAAPSGAPPVEIDDDRAPVGEE